MIQRRQLFDNVPHFGFALEIPACEAIAVDREQDFRLDLAKALDHGVHAEFRRRRGPDGADGERRHHGDRRLGNIGHIGSDAVARRDAQSAQLRRQNAHLTTELAPAHRRQRTRLRTGLQGRLALASFRLMAQDRKSTRLNSSHITISYAVFCLKKKKNKKKKKHKKKKKTKKKTTKKKKKKK